MLLFGGRCRITEESTDMNRSNYKFLNFSLVMTLCMFVSACGKSMSVQVEGEDDKAQKTSETIGGKIKLNVPSQELTNFSQRDFDELGIKEIENGDLYRRAIVQVPVAKAVLKVLDFKIELNGVKLSSDQPASVCVLVRQGTCYPVVLSSDGQASINLLAGFESMQSRGKNDVNVLEYITSLGVKFAEPSYYKFRLKFTGIDSIENGSLILQTQVDTKLLPENFNEATCLEHEDDRALSDSEIEKLVKKSELAKVQSEKLEEAAPLKNRGEIVLPREVEEELRADLQKRLDALKAENTDEGTEEGTEDSAQNSDKNLPYEAQRLNLEMKDYWNFIGAEPFVAPTHPLNKQSNN